MTALGSIASAATKASASTTEAHDASRTTRSLRPPAGSTMVSVPTVPASLALSCTSNRLTSPSATHTALSVRLVTAASKLDAGGQPACG
jgi:hypothetical protein